jgi:hypothetical protein
MAHDGGVISEKINKEIAAAFSVDVPTALEASSVISAAPCKLYEVFGRIDSTAATDDYYLQLINAASVPADGAVTLLAAPIKIEHTTGSDTTVDVGFGEHGIAASTGAVWAISTTDFTKTVAGAVASLTATYLATE